MVHIPHCEPWAWSFTDLLSRLQFSPFENKTQILNPQNLSQWNSSQRAQANGNTIFLLLVPKVSLSRRLHLTSKGPKTVLLSSSAGTGRVTLLLAAWQTRPGVQIPGKNTELVLQKIQYRDDGNNQSPWSPQHRHCVPINNPCPLCSALTTLFQNELGPLEQELAAPPAFARQLLLEGWKAKTSSIRLWHRAATGQLCPISESGPGQSCRLLKAKIYMRNIF